MIYCSSVCLIQTVCASPMCYLRAGIYPVSETFCWFWIIRKLVITSISYHLHSLLKLRCMISIFFHFRCRPSSQEVYRRCSSVTWVYIFVLAYFSSLDITVLCTLDARNKEAHDAVCGKEEEKKWKEKELYEDSLLLNVSFAFLPPPVPFLFSSNNLFANHLIMKWWWLWWWW